jgi:hypothetical protein
MWFGWTDRDGDRQLVHVKRLLAVRPMPPGCSGKSLLLMNCPEGPMGGEIGPDSVLTQYPVEMIEQCIVAAEILPHPHNAVLDLDRAALAWACWTSHLTIRRGLEFWEVLSRLLHREQQAAPDGEKAVEMAEAWLDENVAIATGEGPRHVEQQ